MNISITLNEEQTDALNGVVAMRNAALPPDAAPYTATTHLVEVLTAHVDGHVAAFYEAAMTRLGEGAKALPYETRKALIAQVEASLP